MANKSLQQHQEQTGSESQILKHERSSSSLQLFQPVLRISTYLKMYKMFLHLLKRVRPQDVYGDRKISIVHPFWVSFLCVDQIEASISSRGTNPRAFELLNIGLCKPPAPPRGKIVQMLNPPNFFVKGKIGDRDHIPRMIT